MVSYITYNVTVKFFLVDDALIQLRKFPYIPGTLSIFLKNWCYILYDVLIIESSLSFPLIILLIWCITLIGFSMLNKLCRVRIIPNYNWCIILFSVAGLELLVFCWEFHIYIFQGYYFTVSLWYLWLKYKGNTDSVEPIWKCSCVLYFQEEFVKD